MSTATAIYRFEVPGWHPARLNRLLGHWGTRARLKRKDREILYRARLAYAIPAATGKRRVTLTIVLAKSQRGNDPDAYWKSLLDGLVACGLLVDDNRQSCELAKVQYRRAAVKATVIELEDIA